MLRAGEDVPKHLTITKQSDLRFFLCGISKADAIAKLRIDLKKIGYNAILNYRIKRSFGKTYLSGVLARLDPKTENDCQPIIQGFDAKIFTYLDLVHDPCDLSFVWRFFKKLVIFFIGYKLLVYFASFVNALFFH